MLEFQPPRFYLRHLLMETRLMLTANANPKPEEGGANSPCFADVWCQISTDVPIQKYLTMPLTHD